MAVVLNIPEPNEKQKIFLSDHHKYIAYGGSRGGGKSWAVRVKAILLAFKYAGITQMIIRRTYPELYANHIKPFKKMLPKECYKYNDSKKEITFLNGSQIIFKYCANARDLDNFQGTETDILYIDEATQFSEEQYKVLIACVRGVGKDETDIKPKRVYLTCNPGGIGHSWVKRLFVDKVYNTGEDAKEYSFIQAGVMDNKALMEQQPDYIKQLEALPPKLKDAWLYGRWDVFFGQFFEEFRVSPDPQLCHDAGITEEEALQEHRFTHVVKPFEIPNGWKIYRSYDFGFGKPFAVNWYAVDYEGTAYMILELYGCTGTPNEGVKWSPEQQFKEVARIEKEHPYLKGKKIIGVADPSIWDGSRGIAIIEEAEKQHLWFEKGVNDRIPGWMQIHERLKFDEYGHAMLYIFENCKDTIRTIPLMMYDEHKPEDLDTDGEDHICDSLRYFCMARPITPREIKPKEIPLYDPLDQYKKEKNSYNKAIFRR